MSIGLGSFTSGQVSFVEQMAKNTGLDPGVVATWVYLEENGSAAQARQAAGNHDWLNIGYTDTVTLGARNSVWSNPTSAANASSNWLRGTWNDPGFGVSSAGIRTIVGTAGQSPQAQISAIQRSGWASSGYPDFGQVYNELDPALRRALGAGVAKGGVAGAGGSGTVVDGSTTSTYAFQIGGSSNPDEDMWTGINRLAQEVEWYLFSNGEILYYLDGPEMIAQEPAMVLDRVADSAQIIHWDLVYDNTAYGFVSSRTRKFKAVRKTTLQKVTSPTEAQVDVICGITEISGGDVIELKNFGLGDGRWIVGNCSRSVFATHSSLTLVPPIAPLTEFSAAGATGSPFGSITAQQHGVTLSGNQRNKIVQVAKAAITRQAQSHAYQYGQVRPYPASLFGKAPVVTDCSGFSILCYKDAGAGDPNGTGFNGSGSTYTLMARGTAVQTPGLGDLVFYDVIGDVQGPPNHVAVYIGNDQVANMGSQGDPTIQPLRLAGIVGIRSYV